MICEFEHKIFGVKRADFDPLALDIFRFQYQHNALYRQYVDQIGTDIKNVRLVEQIPFLPISFFKTHTILLDNAPVETLFESSGTTGMTPSRHPVHKLAVYRESFFRGFEQFYGPVTDYCVIGLLPSYLERQHSSLVLMVEELSRACGHPQSGFYLYDHEKLAAVLTELEARQQKVLLIGVTFALLDFAEKYPLKLEHTVVMETGGMKGRREEWTRGQVHDFLMQAFQTRSIHSEYGMTELLSQAYSKGEGLFYAPDWMEVLVREEDDPFAINRRRKGQGVINVIDLANIYSCSFIATDDAGRLYPDGSFEVLGRVDHSDVRGCSLMAPASRK